MARSKVHARSRGTSVTGSTDHMASLSTISFDEGALSVRILAGELVASELVRLPLELTVLGSGLSFLDSCSALVRAGQRYRTMESGTRRLCSAGDAGRSRAPAVSARSREVESVSFLTIRFEALLPIDVEEEDAVAFLSFLDEEESSSSSAPTGFFVV